ncbi:ribosomal-protein-alanine N-acetyltransferase [Poseidonocella pacifica]|uniref:Ribosomal-protein-alanine N-acetyltransferase n=1 Tax=Poseidonocella pacifica TaxID=871651 RepID=A0A1I0Z178_9RHOB|nr:GNAT family N-acetyltransferase [Poseidonocella pacifica]SFB18043.1 ribosomal-protein-alanine N-acetyltransferase [Poseidonocella pacifica]
MTAEDLAALHLRAMTGQRPWAAAEFDALLASPYTLLKTDEGAFALAHVILDEAELLMIATDPQLRRQGRARRLMIAWEEDARCRGAERAFLEVAEDNTAAIALYQSAGYAQAGRRPGYYPRASGGPVDALLMHKPLT